MLSKYAAVGQWETWRCAVYGSYTLNMITLRNNTEFWNKKKKQMMTLCDHSFLHLDHIFFRDSEGRWKLSLMCSSQPRGSEASAIAS